MHERDKRVLLRRYLEEGLSKAAISRKVGVGLRTVYRWIESGEASREREGEALGYLSPAQFEAHHHGPPVKIAV